jgi:hypothetical protein
LRVGIGEPGGTAIDYVLSRFSAEERRSLDETLDAAADAVEDWARLGTNKAATRWNAWVLGEGEADDGGPAGRSSAGREVGGRKQGPAGAGGPGEPSADGTAQVGPDGICRTKSGWRKILGLSKDEGR